MAKKKSNSFGKVLMDCVTLVLGGLIFAFLAIPHINSVTYNVLSSKQEILSSFSGYQLINFGDSYDTGVAVVLLILAILAGVVAVFALAKLLVDLGIMKNAGIKKLATYGLAVSALLLLIMTVVCAIVVAAYAGNNYVESLKTGLVAGSLALVLNCLAGAGAFVAAIFATRK